MFVIYGTKEIPWNLWTFLFLWTSMRLLQKPVPGKHLSHLHLRVKFYLKLQLSDLVLILSLASSPRPGITCQQHSSGLILLSAHHLLYFQPFCEQSFSVAINSPTDLVHILKILSAKRCQRTTINNQVATQIKLICHPL